MQTLTKVLKHNFNTNITTPDKLFTIISKEILISTLKDYQRQSVIEGIIFILIMSEKDDKMIVIISNGIILPIKLIDNIKD